MIIFPLLPYSPLIKREEGLPLKDDEIAEILKEQNEEYKKLCGEHKKLKQVLTEIDKNKYLTSEEEVERKKIQKQKLLKKDRMAEIIREYKGKKKNDN